MDDIVAKRVLSILLVGWPVAIVQRYVVFLRVIGDDFVFASFGQ